MYCKYTTLSFVIIFGLILQFKGSQSASTYDIQLVCADKEKFYSPICKEKYRIATSDFKTACCNTFAIEQCIVDKVPDECKAKLAQHYANQPLKKTECKRFINNCDDNTGTTSQTTVRPKVDPRSETLKQSISSPPQTNNAENLEEAVHDGARFTASQSALLMATCSCALLVVSQFSRWFRF